MAAAADKFRRGARRQKITCSVGRKSKKGMEEKADEERGVESGELERRIRSRNVHSRE